MRYVKCIKNKAYIHLPGEHEQEEDTTDLAVGKVYKTVPQTSDDRRLGELRVFDESGEDYLFPVDYFEPYIPNDADENLETVTMRLNTYMKNILRAEALASQKSVSALLREWIDERLDLPTAGD
jgi:hypothetical protein